MSYSGLRVSNSSESPHLGGNVIEGDPHTFAPKVWQFLVDRFAIGSVLDLGSGMGYAAEYFHRHGVRTLAVDGLLGNVRSSVYPTIQMDLTESVVRCHVDLVHCQEVAEHIAPAFIENLLSSLTCGKYVVMTHALPGQIGHHHVNCQPAEYWIENLSRHDCYYLEEDTRRMRKIAQTDGAHYLVQSGLLFANRARI